MEANELSCQRQAIILTFLNGTGYIFNPYDYLKIRTKWRIVGSLIGTNTAKGWSPNQGLPAELNKWELQLLVEKGVAILVSKSVDLLRIPSEDDLNEHEHNKNKLIEEQSDCLKMGLINASLQNIDKIIVGRTHKLLSTGVTKQDIHLQKDDILNEIKQEFKFNRNNAITEVPLQHPLKYECQIIQLPDNDSLKYRVFKDLWSKNKYVTSGESFGGDFLAYPGDPMLFHSSHIIIILEEPIISPMELIAKCRLSVIVNKSCVLAYLDLYNNIKYQTVKWEAGQH